MQEFDNMMRNLLDDYDEYKQYELNGSFTRGLRVNTLKIDIRRFELLAQECGISLEPTPFSPLGYSVSEGLGDHIFHRCGLFYMQDPSAMCVGTAIAPYIGDRVLDMCAAPGGKTTHAAALMGDKGVLVANEIIFNRAKVLRSNLERLGVRNALVTNNAPSAIAAAMPQYFDTIIVDAPCSGEGMFLKEPQARDMWSMRYVEECAARQLEILNHADNALANGGYLCYSTCTFNTVENEHVIHKFLNSHDYTLMPIAGLERCTSAAFGLDCARRIFPHRHKGLGHFVCVMRKGGTAVDEPQYVKYSPYAMYKSTEFDRLWSEISAVRPWGKAYTFSDSIYILPDNLPLAKGLKIVTGGVKAAEIVRSRVVPHHALAMALRQGEANDPLDYDYKSLEVGQYLKGTTINCGGKSKGYRTLTIDNIPLGLVKISDGVAKNHYPKGLRR